MRRPQQSSRVNDVAQETAEREFLLETGQTVRWRGRRWRVLDEEEGGFVRLVGVDSTNRDQVVTPLLVLEGEDLRPDVLPLPALNVEATDRARWRALHRAFLTTMAGGREHLVGLDWGALAVEPYQLVPLMRVAKTMRPRLLIADDTGLGKTAEAGIVLRWLSQRHQAGRVLIVTRASPEPERWKREMWVKFGFRFDILRSGADFLERRRRAPTVNVFAQEPRLIISMTLAARQVFRDELRQCPVPFDVVIVDEAHHLAERGSRTKLLAHLGRVLAKISADGALLLLTATPHDGKSDSFLSLLRLLDPLIEVQPGEVPLQRASRLVARRLKTEVTLSGGKKFIEPQIHVVSTLGDACREEKALDGLLDKYLGWLAEEEERYEGTGARQKATGCEFLAGVLRKRFGSSVAALRATLRRRLGLPSAPEDADDDVPYVDTDASDPEDEIIDPGVAAESPPPDITAKETELARALLQAAEKVPQGRDSKLEAMVRLLGNEIAGEKAVIFTEYRDTLRAAARRLRAEGITFVTFHGETPDASRERVIETFLRDPDVKVFLATDAASEGKNLQSSCRHLVHLDVPWNPNRYAQRNGRIDRYGQRKEPHIWVLVAADRKKKQGRPEHRALEVVVEKLRTIQHELGSVSPVLPGFMSSSVRDILLRAEKDAERQLTKQLDDPDLRRANEDLNRLTTRNRREIEEAEAYVKQLGTTDDFSEPVGNLLRVAFHGWDDGGGIEEVEDGVVRVSVPARLRAALGRDTIPRATFRRDIAVAAQEREEPDVPEFLSPAHPLVEGTLRLLRDEAFDPAFGHRFDVAVDDKEGLVFSFVVRYVDGEGRTVEERLLAVAVGLDGAPGGDPAQDEKRLGVESTRVGGKPDPKRIDAWRRKFPALVETARAEASRRAEDHRQSLVEAAREIYEDELQALALWRAEEEVRVETITLGTGLQPTLEAGEAYERGMKELEAEYEARKEAIRDRSEVRVSSIELIGGRLIVRGRS